MEERDKPRDVQGIKKEIADEAETTGITESLLIEGVIVPEEQIRRSVVSTQEQYGRNPHNDGRSTEPRRTES